ncbi:ubiquitin-activating enzyme E1 family protein [Trichomonas vaginalis G3]|uniref:Ubiquitin-activating enzyme E1 family protein n=1 Tax=Trichomonas vaginalis (strain ATCC PRA-98 / G3) TaxID=412133 RepID=A2F917_TRIV3|nr:ubiquitin-activating enzyme E1 family [Trichomonas vaginalis G3]EAX98592.1 ubiquitin-activating enzyme E1 family protein [Trichomonas vaginalis G3]KAI5498381.1 ubiquitin-activating enzyme E1 family [Trichomonas vaginalis G3]|eukprot:XP_001311522.1 ubiquitin-activating enzyme E1 family protein [Trichomonas vaginalis G3]
MTNTESQLYSRQIYTFGEDAMKAMSSTSVLISGMNGLGVEIAKNIILMGEKSVTIHDTKATTMSDLSSQFYLNESDIGKNRAEACYQKLVELNEFVKVNIATCELTNEFLGKFNIVVLADFYPYSKLLEMSDFCHANHIKFILTQCSGLFGFVFNDFGEKHFVTKGDDYKPKPVLIFDINNEENGCVSTYNNANHFLSEGDVVKFEDIEGMTEINGKEFKVTSVIDYSKFTIGDTTKFSEFLHEGKGIFTKVKQPFTMDFPSLQESFKGPIILDSDYANPGQNVEIISCFLSMSKYNEMYPNEEVDKEKFTNIAQKVCKELNFCDEISNLVLDHFLRGYGLHLSPICAIFGGIVGQEVIKFVTHMFTPILSYLALGNIEATLSNVVYEPVGDRYDAYRKVFGNNLQNKIMNLKYFMIGAGALGCELLKNFAMMGCFTGEKGNLTITDMDAIEVSNLSRQFLFHKNDIGQLKSVVAAQSVKKMNPDIKITSHSNLFNEETRVIYNDDFYESLDGVCNALDNIPTRRKSDDLCVFYNKPLLESGTQGTRCNYQAIVPGVTQSYNDKNDPEDEGIPECTLHRFPSDINHCAEWSRELFLTTFDQMPTMINKFISDPNSFINENKKDSANINQVLKILSKPPVNFPDCLKISMRRFYKYFVWRIEDILEALPPDHKDEEGHKFWTGSKRCPHPIEFDINSELHRTFVISFAKIWARMFSIEVKENENEIQNLLKNIEKPDKNDKIKLDYDINDIDFFVNLAKNSKLLNIEQFEKDDDSNSQIDLMYSSSNIRASNYKINNVSKLEIKRIVGKIIPSLATTTAMICGFVALEMYKIHSIDERLNLEGYTFNELEETNKQPKKMLYEVFRDSSFDISFSDYIIGYPAEADIYKSKNEKKFTKWTRVLFDDLAVKEFINKVKELYGFEVTKLIYLDKVLYYIPRQKAAASSKQEMEKRSEMKISDLVKYVGENSKDKFELHPTKKYLDIKVIVKDYENTLPIFVVKIK